RRPAPARREADGPPEATPNPTPAGPSPAPGRADPARPSPEGTPMSFSTTRKRLTWTAIAATAALTLTACGGGGTGGSSADGDDEGPIRIGVVGASDDKWAVFQEQAEAEGIEIELVDLQDYTQATIGRAS